MPGIGGLATGELGGPSKPGSTTAFSSAIAAATYGDGSDGPILFVPTPQQRTVTDATLTPGSTTIQSATANFTNADIGLVLADGAGFPGTPSGLQIIPPGTRIKSVTDSTHAVMTGKPQNITAVTINDTVLIGSTEFWPGSYSSVTIQTGATAAPPSPVTPDGGVVLCSGEYFIDGTIDISGTSQGATRNGASGTTGPGTNSGQNYWPPLGGDGGAGTHTTLHDTPGGYNFPIQEVNNAIARQPFGFLGATLSGMSFGAQGGGASGGGDGTNNGGTGGDGGVFWFIAAQSVVHGIHATYKLTGQAGSTGTGGNTGGGGGGADGWWITISESLVGAPTLIGGGGPGGAGLGTGLAGTAGARGFGVHYTPSGVVIQSA